METTQTIRHYQDLNTGVKKWRRKLQDREEWRLASEETKVHQELQRQKKKKWSTTGMKRRDGDNVLCNVS